MRGGGKTYHSYRYYNKNYCLLGLKQRDSIKKIKRDFFVNLKNFYGDINKTHINFLYNSSTIWEIIFA